MRYVSTRGSAPALDFAGATLAGLAPDGGLFVPERWPRFSHGEIRALRGLPYPALAARVMQPFVGDSLTPQRLEALCTEAYGRFAHVAVTPLTQLDERNWLLELFHGPTLAFKDIALQMLGLLFEEFLARENSALTVVGATSGDTGSAAINALANRDRVEIFMLHPAGRVSDVQRVQMTTVRAPNVHNVAIEGDFDQAQAMVKRLFADEAVTVRHRLGAVNSINWARLMAQVVYYFAAALQLGAPDRKVAFSVPTGNFGDVFAGYVAAQMGLPIERLVVATNINDILFRALSEGDYSAGDGDAHCRAFDGHPGQLQFRTAAVRSWRPRWCGADSADGRLRAEPDDAPHQCPAPRRGRAVRYRARRWRRHGASDALGVGRMWCEVIDPHTAVGLHAARALDWPDAVPVVTLATAHPAKFRDAVERATGSRPSLPPRVGDLFAREERYTTLAGGYEPVRDFILDNAIYRL